MKAKLTAAQTAAAGGDRTTAMTDLNDVQALVTTAANAGQLTSAQLRALVTGLGRTRQEIMRTVPAKSVRPASTTPTTPPAPGPPGGPPGHGKKHGHGNGQGDGGDGGD